MSKTRDLGNITNVIKVDATGNVSFVSGSTTLATISTSGQMSGSLPALSSSYALSASYVTNAETLDGLDSTVFTLTSSFNTTSASLYTVSSSAYATSGSLSATSGSLSATSGSLSAASGSLSATSGSLSAASGSLSAASGSFNTRVTALEITGSALSSSILSVSASSYSTSGSLSSASGSFDTRISTVESKYATTGSNTFIGTQIISGSILQSGSFTSTGTLTAQTLVVQTITSSVVYSSGSNIFGNAIGNTQTFTGSVLITGSLTIAVGGNASAPTIFGSTIACSPIGCFTTSCATSFIGGTMSGTTIYGSTAVCSPVGKFSTCLDLGGALTGTSATFSGNIRRSGSAGVYTELQSDGVYAAATDLYLLAPSTKSVFIYAGNVQALQIASTGAATFSSTITGTTIYGSTAVCSAVGKFTSCIDITSAATTGTALRINGDNLTTGTALSIVSNDGSASHTGNLVEICNAFNAGAAAKLMCLYQGDDGDGIYINMARGGVGLTVDGAGTGYSAIFGNGNIGIGTSTPLSLLHIASADSDQGLRLTRANGTYGFRFTRTGLIQGTLTDGTTFQTAIELSEGNSSANNYLALQPTSGSVLIGSSINNFGKLDITVAPSSYTAALGLGLQTNSGEGNSVGISFKTKVSLSGVIWENARIAAFTDAISSSAYGALAFYTMSATTLCERMRIGNNGYIGIGIASPGAKLHVDGTIFSTTRSNTIDTDDGVSNNFQGYGGYWALRTDNSNRFNLDVYNSGTPINALQLSLAGESTFSKSITATGLTLSCSTGLQKIAASRLFTANTTTYYDTTIGQAGMLIINSSNDRAGVFVVSAPGAGNSAISEIGDPSSYYSTTCNNANTVNFFFSAGSGNLIMQNCSGTTRDFSITHVGTP